MRYRPLDLRGVFLLIEIATTTVLYFMKPRLILLVLGLIWSGGRSVAAPPPTIEISPHAPLPVWFVPLPDSIRFSGWEIRDTWNIPPEFPWKDRIHEMTKFWLCSFGGRSSIRVRVPSPPMTEPLGPIELISHPVSAESDPAAMLATVKSAALDPYRFEPGYGTIEHNNMYPIALLDLFAVDGSGLLAKVIKRDMPVRVLVLPFGGVADELDGLVLPESVEKLVIYNMNIDSRFIGKFANCPRLRDVVFWGCSMNDYNLPRLGSAHRTRAEASQGGRVKLTSATLINCSQGLFDWVCLSSGDSLETLEIGPNPKLLMTALARARVNAPAERRGAMQRFVIYASTASELTEPKSEVRHMAESLGRKLNLTAPGSIRIVPLKAQ